VGREKDYFGVANLFYEGMGGCEGCAWAMSGFCFIFLRRRSPFLNRKV